MLSFSQPWGAANICWQTWYLFIDPSVRIHVRLVGIFCRVVRGGDFSICAVKIVFRLVGDSTSKALEFCQLKTPK